MTEKLPNTNFPEKYSSINQESPARLAEMYFEFHGKMPDQFLYGAGADPGFANLKRHLVSRMIERDNPPVAQLPVQKKVWPRLLPRKGGFLGRR